MTLHSWGSYEGEVEGLVDGLKPLTFTSFETELEKIANWKLRAAETAIGGGLGAGGGYLATRDDDKRYSAEAAGALAGAILGAGTGVGASGIIRALRARALANRELPGALVAGREALKGPATAHAHEKDVLTEVQKRTGRILRGPAPAQPDLAGQQAAEAAAIVARGEMGAANQAFDTDIANAVAAIKANFDARVAALPAEADALVANRVISIKARNGWIAQAREEAERALRPEAMALESGDALPLSARATYGARSLARQRVSSADASARGIAGENAQRTRHAQDWDAAQQEVRQAEERLGTSKKALDEARKTHGDSAVRESVASRAHDTYKRKLFGIVG